VRQSRASQRELDALSKARVIYLATIRRDGRQSKAAPIWFTVTPSGAILIQTGPASWRAKRIRRGSPVIVWTSKRGGPAFGGSAEITEERAVIDQIVDDYPKKYLMARLGLHRPTKRSFERGERLAIKITPIHRFPDGFTAQAGAPAPALAGAPEQAWMISGNIAATTIAARGLLPENRRQGVVAQAANLLSASRVVLAGIWAAVFFSHYHATAATRVMALAAAASDLLDGPLARWMQCANRFGEWLDSIADVIFVLTALACLAYAGTIPAYIPALVAASFAQYALDSVLIRESAVPVRSRLGHWGGIVNYLIVVLFAWAPPPQLPGRIVGALSPLIGLFYVAAICERALSYGLAH